MISVLDVFRIGIGPSSSHTVGPMRIAHRFISELSPLSQTSIEAISVELIGSLAYTGEGHGTPDAVLMGLLGYEPETIDVSEAQAAIRSMKENQRLRLPNGREVQFNPDTDVRLVFDAVPGLHPNEMRLKAFGPSREVLAEETFYSTGGGFIATEDELKKEAEAAQEADDTQDQAEIQIPFNFSSAQELIGFAKDQQTTISEIVMQNELCWRSQADIYSGLDQIIEAMALSINKGLTTEGVLPGKLNVRRRAPALWERCQEGKRPNEREGLFDQLNVYAMAVNEENAAGGKVVTAPTNGAAGLLPSVLRLYILDQDLDPQAARDFLLTAGAVGILFKQKASISGAAMGCQGEVGVACSMAAAGLASFWDGTPDQVSTAAEIAMEHNLGLTCDPVGGLVQIPCIERNAIGAVKAVNAARLALQRDGTPKVTLDQVIETMRQTGVDMSEKYKETSRGGLAVNVVEC